MFLIFLSPDVHWVWHCHILSPTAYYADLTQHSDLGRALDHRPRALEEWNELRDKTRPEWNKREEEKRGKKVEYRFLGEKMIFVRFQRDKLLLSTRKKM